MDIDIHEQTTNVSAEANSDAETTPTAQETQQDASQPQTVQPAEYTKEQFESRTQVENDLKSDLETKGISWDDLSAEYYETGNLSQRTRAELAKAGYPQTVVDNYLNGMQMEQELFVSTVHNSVGGEAEFQRIADYMATKSPQEVQAFNNVMLQGNIDTIRMVLHGIKAEMVSVYGTNNRTILGGTQSLTDNAHMGYEDKNDMLSAMSDPRYGKDKRYTKEVEQKVKQSNFFNL